jgi:PPOX class probable F420-dependent enzyme
MIEPAIRQLATAKNFGTLSVHLPNGQIATNVMWVDATDDHVLINTEIHRPKYQAMKANPDVTVTIWDSTNPYRYAEVRGNVVDEVRGDEARAHIDALSDRYTGTVYQGKIESERVILHIEPNRQRKWGL